MNTLHSHNTASKVLPWSSLPTEIRNLILYKLAKEATGFSRYASVCREWQKVIETINFAQLRITPSCLSRFNMFARSRRAILRCIKFRILLQEYDCSQCDLMSDYDWDQRDQDIIEDALRALVLTLATWEPCDSSLILDISIHSPSDAKRHHQNFIFETDDDDDDNGMQGIAVKDDVRHGWKQNRQVSFPPLSSLYRVFSLTELSPQFWVNLPLVSLQRLIPYFQGLEVFHYEPWRDWAAFYIDETDAYYRCSFEILSECSFKHIVIFEDFDDYYVKDHPRLMYEIDPIIVRKADTAVSEALAQASLGFESLSASFVADAGQFFAACQTTWVWNRLTSLTLTSRTLNPKDHDWVKTNNLLQAAAFVTMKMPKLHTMALWNYSRKFVGMFLYQTSVAQRLVKVTWRATWNVDLTPAVVRSWEAVARSHGMLGTIIVKESLDSRAACKSHGHAVEYLRFPCQVLHPDSVLQIQQEFSSCRNHTNQEQNDDTNTS